MLVFEAMAARRAIVATRVGGIPFLVEDGREGLLVESGDSDALSRALAGVLAEPEEAQRLGRAGKARLEAAFSHVSAAREMAKVYAAAADSA